MTSATMATTTMSSHQSCSRPVSSQEKTLSCALSTTTVGTARLPKMLTLPNIPLPTTTLPTVTSISSSLLSPASFTVTIPGSKAGHRRKVFAHAVAPIHHGDKSRRTKVKPANVLPASTSSTSTATTSFIGSALSLPSTGVPQLIHIDPSFMSSILGSPVTTAVTTISPTAKAMAALLARSSFIKMPSYITSDVPLSVTTVAQGSSSTTLPSIVLPSTVLKSPQLADVTEVESTLTSLLKPVTTIPPTVVTFATPITHGDSLEDPIIIDSPTTTSVSVIHRDSEDVSLSADENMPMVPSTDNSGERHRRNVTSVTNINSLHVTTASLVVTMQQQQQSTQAAVTTSHVAMDVDMPSVDTTSGNVAQYNVAHSPQFPAGSRSA